MMCVEALHGRVFGTASYFASSGHEDGRSPGNSRPFDSGKCRFRQIIHAERAEVAHCDSGGAVGQGKG